MFKRIMAAALVCVLMMSMVTVAMADTFRYCPVCDRKIIFRDECSNKLKYNTGYIQHTVDGHTCNYYEAYYKTMQNCAGCGALYDPNTSHKHKVVHDICGTQYTCPF